MHFAHNIKLLRKRRNRTQDELAHTLGMKRSTLSGYENEVAEPSMMVVGVGHLPQLEGYDPPNLKLRTLIGSGESEGYVPVNDLYLESLTDAEEIDGSDPFVVISTAAVAGVPRGAVLSHDNMLIAGFPVISALGLDSNDRHLAALPLFHITGLGLSLVILQVGGANVLMETFDPAGAAK